MLSLRSPGRSGQYRILPGAPYKGFRCSLSYKQLLWLTATVFCTGLLTVPPSLQALNSLSSTGADRQDSFASPVAEVTTAAPGGHHAALKHLQGLPEQQQGPLQQHRWWRRSGHAQQQQQEGPAPVDIVYLWVNGSDPDLSRELDHFTPAQKKQPAAAAAAAARKPAVSASKPTGQHAKQQRQGQEPKGAAAGSQHKPVVPQQQQQQQQGVSHAAAASKPASRHLLSAAAGTPTAAAPLPHPTTHLPTASTGQQQQQQHASTANATAQHKAAAAGAGAKPSSNAVSTAHTTTVTAAPTNKAVAAATHPLKATAAKPAVVATATHPTKAVARPATAPIKAPAKAPAKAVAKRPVPLPLSELPTRQARFDAGRDELRFSVRSLERHLPWYRHLYIVTNGQVPSWLDLSNPRVSLVPHSSIFRNASHLPTFNSNAIQANLVNIPGIAPHFIMMDDDLFLTAPWTRSDFIPPGGGQVLTGTALANNISGPSLPMYMKAMRQMHAIFQAAFGPWRRYLPAHAPHYMEVEWLRKMQQRLPGAFKDTSAAQLRTDKDVILSAAYNWFVSQFQPGTHPPAPDNRSAFVSLSNYIAKCYAVMAVNDIRTGKTPKAAQYRAKVLKTKPLTMAINAEYKVGIEAALDAAAAGEPPGKYLAGYQKNHTQQLTAVWDGPGVKMVALQDDFDSLYDAVRPLVNPTVVKFLSSRYPQASQYELPAGRVNNCRRIKPKGFGHLPTAADIAAACGTPAATVPVVHVPRRGLVRPQVHDSSTSGKPQGQISTA